MSKQPVRSSATRIPVGALRQKVGGKEFQIPGFHTHWVKDREDRIFQMTEAGYEFVLRDELSQNRARPDLTNADTALNKSRVMKPGGADEYGPFNLVLMKLPLELYTQDQKAKSAAIAEMEDAMNLYNNAGGSQGYKKSNHGIKRR